MAYDQKTLENIATLRSWIDECPPSKLVFFGGAGVSTESGIPDFRSADGLYNQKCHYAPETIISHHFFVEHPQMFYEFYFSKMVFTDAQPNRAHKKLAQLEEQGKLSAVITQNIDGLHQAAGSKNVLELHGAINRNYCQRCGAFYDLDAAMAARGDDGIPRCSCGGLIKPDVVLYEESLDSDILSNSVRAIQQADLLIIAGTSLVVYPAAGLIDYFNGSHLAIINLSPTPGDQQADLCIAAKVGDVLGY